MEVKLENLFSTYDGEWCEMITIYSSNSPKILYREKAKISDGEVRFKYNQIEFIYNIRKDETTITLKSVLEWKKLENP